MKKYISNLILLSSAFFYLSTTVAQKSIHKQPVNILTWWGYLDNPAIKKAAEERCHVEISYDQYYSHDEFLRRWRMQKKSYDILIFSKTVYNIIKDEIPNIKNSHLATEATQYNDIIRRQYIKSNYPNNVVFFTHGLTGFMYNPSSISINSNDSISEIFQKANNKLVVIIDEPLDAKILLNVMLNTKDTNVLNITNFNKLVTGKTLYIGNGLVNIYKNQKFAFDYTWSGDAICHINERYTNFKFLIHPKLSYVSSDLLAQTNERKEASCIANMLTSKQILSLIENTNYYFSSYTEIKNIKNLYFKKIYKEFLTNLPSLQWIESINSNEFEKNNNSWEMIKIHLLNRYSFHEHT